MARIAIKDLKPRQELENTFLVKHIALAEAKDGKKYLNIIFTDSTGDLEGRSWNNAEEIFNKIDKGRFVVASGKVNIYQGRKQFILKDISQVNSEQVDAKDFVYQAQQDPETMHGDLIEIVQSLKDFYIRGLLISVLNDKEIKRRLLKWQAGKTIHHAYPAGLLEHMLSCSKLAKYLSPYYGVNENYVVAGAILHDLCKIYELTDDYNVEYTEEGKLVGHLVKGIEIIDRFSYRVKEFPYQLKLHLKHILLSHHGEYAFGSPKIPQTSEAMLVHLIDLMDSKMHTFETIKRTDQNTGHWSGYVKHLDRIVFKDELPFFSEPMASREDKKKDSRGSDLKHSMADALKNFKVD
jgi:3'-5' exoribonuclease